MQTRDSSTPNNSSGITPDGVGRGNVRIFVFGMDCQDCGGKVNKAALNLPSVRPIAFDYINATADFLYDPGK
jgi:hypothetical protein